MARKSSGIGDGMRQHHNHHPPPPPPPAPSPMLLQRWHWRCLIAGVNCVYSSQFLVPDCSRQQYHLSEDRRTEAAGKLFARPPLNHYLATVRYECYLEQKAGEYLAIPLEEKERRTCPSGLKCLSYWSYNLGSDFSDILDAALATWEYNKNLTAMEKADQVGCNFSEDYLTQEIACFFRPIEP
ncbi:unnamed protein product [Heligmosomoides polygyrus]|uniref:SCP domain-containing protein n=1 Tax=Heligmosomoides polygyrus TaxID=6339 RepID=A0A3P7XFD4_HELPZ|nr:unnamed protein product [Heligmosomoides polygyrus]